jgi:hypothetical protein
MRKMGGAVAPKKRQGQESAPFLPILQDFVHRAMALTPLPDMGGRRERYSRGSCRQHARLG